MLTKKIKDIANISIITNAKLDENNMNDKFNTFFVIEDKEGTNRLLNISTGQDISFDNKSIALFKGKSQIKKLYSYNKNTFINELDLGYINNITYYKKVELINDFNNNVITRSDIFEIIDEYNNKIYIDPYHNNIYTRQNYCFLSQRTGTKIIKIFEKGIENNINLRKIKTKLFDFENLFFEEE